MGDARNPQAAQMADESMVRNLAAQMEAVWPQEEPLLRGYGLPAEGRLLDVGCGTGEFTARLAELFPRARVLGVDLDASHLERARVRCRVYGGRVEFRVGDAFQLELDDDGFDLAACRHLLQAVPTPERVVGELIRVTKPGGRVHLVVEDYGMMHFHPTDLDTDLFWHQGPIRFAELTGSDLRSGRKMFTVLRQAGLEDVRIDYVTIDTVRVPREVFARIWRAWRDGYAEVIAEKTGIELATVQANFEQMIAAIEDPDGYGVWHLPVVSGIVPPPR